ncbi:MAG: helix-turn-helix domain-containing protein [Ilumatobacteraceae bacterium]
MTAAVVVDRGARLAVGEGLDAVTVRAVAKQLGVTPMALYRHVGDAEDLRAAVVDQLLAGMPVVAPVGTWEDRCRAWALSARLVLGQAPGLAQHVLVNWLHLPHVLRAVDSLVATLDDTGPPDCDPVAGANAILMHVLMRAQAEEALRNGGLERDLSTLRDHRRQLPHLWSHRHEYRRARIDEHFAYGLEALLTGLATTRRNP